MRRKMFDALLSTGGLLIAVVLIVSGALLTWGHSFVSSQVHTQLAAEKIFFPDKAGIAAQHDAEITKFVSPYAGQQVVNGQQAAVFANHYIGVHLKAAGGGLTYSQLSAKAIADPTNVKLQGQVATMFKGETLRGLLLNSYAFDKMGQIALVGSIVSFVGAALMLLLAGFGFLHLRRTDPAEQVLTRLGARTPAPVEI
ncbi:MAG: hypothetical protein QOJ29_4083 [Thermoleophilaceae bacterium]|jgi:hypothetical protein|nr:hypothetical protein [Thermoleophilaceae bacterium]